MKRGLPPARKGLVMVNIEATGYAPDEHGIVPPEGLGADKEKVDAAKAEGDESDFENVMCPACGKDDCYVIDHLANKGWIYANSWGGSEFIILGTQRFRKDLPVKVVAPAPRFKDELFWVVK